MEKAKVFLPFSGKECYNNYQKISDVCEQCLTAIKIQENKSAQQQNKSEKQIK